MSLTFPLSFPSTAPAPSALSIRRRSVVGMSRSPFTGEQEVQAHQGAWWEWDVQLPPMRRDVAEGVVSTIIALNGFEGTLLYGFASSPRGIATGTPLVKGGGQTGRTLLTDGWTISQTGIVKAGDWFQVGAGAGSHLHKVVQDANSNGSGEAPLEMWPRLRSAPADNAALAFNNPVGLWRLASNADEFSIGAAMTFGVSFQLVEAL